MCGGISNDIANTIRYCSWMPTTQEMANLTVGMSSLGPVFFKGNLNDSRCNWRPFQWIGSYLHTSSYIACPPDRCRSYLPTLARSRPSSSNPWAFLEPIVFCYHELQPLIEKWLLDFNVMGAVISRVILIITLILWHNAFKLNCHGEIVI